MEEGQTKHESLCTSLDPVVRGCMHTYTGRLCRLRCVSQWTEECIYHVSTVFVCHLYRTITFCACNFCTHTAVTHRQYKVVGNLLESGTWIVEHGTWNVERAMERRT